MSPTAPFDRYEEDFADLAAKAGCRLAMIGSSSSPSSSSPPAAAAAADQSTSAAAAQAGDARGDCADDTGDKVSGSDGADGTNAKAAGGGGGSSSSSSSSSHGDAIMDDLEHLHVTSMLLGQASDLLDLMEVEVRRTRDDPEVQSDLRKRMDGCAEVCSALRAECREVRREVRDRRDAAAEEEEAEETVEFGGGEAASSSDGGSPAAWSARPTPSKSSRSRPSSATSAAAAAARNSYRSTLFDRTSATTSTLASQNATLDNARRVMADTEVTAGTITEELARNRETILSSSGRVAEVNGLMNSARRTVKTMQRRKKWMF